MQRITRRPDLNLAHGIHQRVARCSRIPPFFRREFPLTTENRERVREALTRVGFRGNESWTSVGSPNMPARSAPTPESTAAGPLLIVAPTAETATEAGPAWLVPTAWYATRRLPRMARQTFIGVDSAPTVNPQRLPTGTASWFSFSTEEASGTEQVEGRHTSRGFAQKLPNRLRAR